MEGREAARNLGQVAHARHGDVEEDHQQRHDADTRQRGGNDLGDFRRGPDDRHGQRGQGQHKRQLSARQPFALRHAMPARAMLRRAGFLKLAQLGQKNNDGQPVDETQHHRMRHQPDELAPSQHADRNLDDPHQDDRRKEIFDPVLGHQGHHHHRQSACRTRDHAGAAADNRGDQPNDEGRIEPHQRVNARHEGEGHGLWHQRQRHGQPGQDFDAPAACADLALGHQLQVVQKRIVGKGCQKAAGHAGLFG